MNGEPNTRQRVYQREGGPQMTKQADALDTDVNKIVARFATTGELPDNFVPPKYGDFTNVTDYHTALNLVKDAMNDFMELPAEVRRHVDNDPGKFLDLVHDPERRGELEELGLVEARAPETAPPAEPKKETPAADPPPEPAPTAPAA